MLIELYVIIGRTLTYTRKLTVFSQMVLDAGRIVEFDTPQALLAKDAGHFQSLVGESSDREALYAMAQRNTS